MGGGPRLQPISRTQLPCPGINLNTNTASDPIKTFPRKNVLSVRGGPAPINGLELQPFLLYDVATPVPHLVAMEMGSIDTF